jgi:intracellular sulfur oxidation DsrE/DsrF family protein
MLGIAVAMCFSGLPPNASNRRSMRKNPDMNALSSFRMNDRRAPRLAKALLTGTLALLLSAPSASAQSSKSEAATQRPAPTKAANKRKATAVHKLAIQVAENDAAKMNLALNNAVNVIKHFKAKGETAMVEIVTFGPGLHMLRQDTSPVRTRLASLALETPSLSFSACRNTQANMSKAEGKPVALVGEAAVTPSGVVRLMELQSQGYRYIRP